MYQFKRLMMIDQRVPKISDFRLPRISRKLGLRQVEHEQGFSSVFFAQIFGIIDDFSKWSAPKFWQKLKKILVQVAINP